VTGPATLDWRIGFPVLVTEAQTPGAIAVIRSLGRAGYPVHASAPAADALGLRSRYASEGYISPKYESSEFVPWIRRLITDRSIEAIVPSESLLLALRPHFKEFSALLPYSQLEEVLYSGLSKVDQITRLSTRKSASEAEHLPPFLLFDDRSQMPLPQSALANLGIPLYIKVDGSYARAPLPGRVYKACSTQDASAVVADALRKYRKVLVEGHVPGRGVGVFFLLWNGEVRAEFMHIRLHEVPHTGGVSSYRKSWWHEGIRNDALLKLRALNWQGVAMMEYRWEEARDQFYFMEMNGRFWGSLHLALRAGVDFPAMLLDCFHSRERAWAPRPNRNVKCRYTFPSDVMYVRSRWKDPSLSWSQKLWSLVEFVLLGLNPQVGSDLWFPGDTKLYWLELVRFAKLLLSRTSIRRRSP
jgi:hypothetical protein